MRYGQLRAKSLHDRVQTQTLKRHAGATALCLLLHAAPGGFVVNDLTLEDRARGRSGSNAKSARQKFWQRLRRVRPQWLQCSDSGQLP